VTVDAPEDRFPDAVESTAYFVASEALANVAKYSEASAAEVLVARSNGRLQIAITDDGKGGADPGAGSGLAGLADRVAALDGRLTVDSPEGTGTTVTAELPLGEER
jgi:signal transduction histidine kinase